MIPAENQAVTIDYRLLQGPPLIIAIESMRSVRMSADQYLAHILQRETVNTGPLSPVRDVLNTLTPILQVWGGQYFLHATPSGSFAKGTAIRSGTDIDIFISLAENTPDTLRESYYLLKKRMVDVGYQPKEQNVSIKIRVGNYDVDLVPGTRQHWYNTDHSLYRRKANTWTKTNVDKHIAHVRGGGWLNETKLFKVWRNQKQLDFPSFYLELSIMNALGIHSAVGSLMMTSPSANVVKILEYLREKFSNARIMDPANTNNIISDDLTAAEKAKIKAFAVRALAGNWSDFVS
jgi:hypothetical protein